MDLAKRRGFIWPTSECYGAVAGFIDYGPLGAMMKRRIENIWRQFYVVQEGYYEIECPTIAQEAVFIASGHVKGFSDKMCQCPHCKEYLRADHVADGGGVCGAATMNNETLAAAIATCKCPACGEVLGNVEVYNFNLMFSTMIGPGSQRVGYLRPETAQGMFVDFARLLRFYRDKLPFGAVQIGKSYRNEISPRQGMIRLREFTQAEAEIFVHPNEKNHHPAFKRYANYRMPLLTYVHQQKCEPAVEMSMREAVDKGIIANEYVAYYVALTHELLVTVGIRPAAGSASTFPMNGRTTRPTAGTQRCIGALRLGRDRRDRRPDELRPQCPRKAERHFDDGLHPVRYAKESRTPADHPEHGSTRQAVPERKQRRSLPPLKPRHRLPRVPMST